MIDIRELRIGNIVQPTNDIQTEAPGPVDTEWWSIIHEQQRDLKPGEEMEWEIDVEPVPITEEWLERLGFSRNDDMSWFNENIAVEILGPHVECWINTPEPWLPYLNKGFKYVHQVQNLFFALIGKEMTIKN